ncbi:aminotransferase class V-fold PLP-dependent enzyme [Caulobacter sp. FWC26]|jgi:selenocysteine lyase/cysteine desulfurase|nr:aminotransferase class V-fold PLP-dependent enzyme [Caulobacter sp. FWC26]
MPFAPSRRQFLTTAATGGSALMAGAGVAQAATPAAAAPLAPNSIPVAELHRQFDVEPGYHNLEAGYWSMMPRVTAEAFARNTAMVNRANAIWARNVLPGGEGWNSAFRAAEAAIARLVGCGADEIALARSGADALQMLITNYKPLRAGDGVICCDLDYDTMIAAMRWLGTHKGAKVVEFAMPEPATTANILAAYEDVLKRTPEAKLLLVTQVSNKTGLVTPVREIVAMARARGVDTIVDAAHGVACLDFQLEDLGADFVGWSVHKWTSAPLGTGAMYIRKSRLADIDIAFENRNFPDDNINTRIPSGTVNFAAVMTIPTAVDFHFAVGGAAKEGHMRGLRDRWVQAVRDLANVEICVPDDPARYCAITSFRLKGMTTDEAARRVQKRLFDAHRVHTIWRGGVRKAPVIRVTPGLFSTPADVDALVKALRAEHAMLL